MDLAPGRRVVGEGEVGSRRLERESGHPATGGRAGHRDKPRRKNPEVGGHLVHAGLGEEVAARHGILTEVLFEETEEDRVA